LWGTDYQNFAHVELPPDGKLPYASREDHGRDFEMGMVSGEPIMATI